MAKDIENHQWDVADPIDKIQEVSLGKFCHKHVQTTRTFRFPSEKEMSNFQHEAIPDNEIITCRYPDGRQWRYP